jgi:putative transposase
MALALQKDALDKIQKIQSYNHLAGCLVDWKRSEELSFLKTAPSQTLQQTLKALDRAMKDAFDKKQPGKRFPVWKKKFKCSDSFRYPQGFKLEGNRVFLPKIGWVRFHKSREIQGTPRNMTVSRRGKHWFVSIQTEQDVLIPERTVSNPFDDVVGIDMGATRFVTTSQTDETGMDGSFVEPLNSFKKLENKLVRAQRLLSRKQKFSNNWKKQKQAVSKLHIKIADARNDFLQKLSTIMSKNHAVIVAEDLRIKNI